MKRGGGGVNPVGGIQIGPKKTPDFQRGGPRLSHILQYPPSSRLVHNVKKPSAERSQSRMQTKFTDNGMYGGNLLWWIVVVSINTLKTIISRFTLPASALSTVHPFCGKWNCGPQIDGGGGKQFHSLHLDKQGGISFFLTERDRSGCSWTTCWFTNQHFNSGSPMFFAIHLCQAATRQGWAGLLHCVEIPGGLPTSIPIHPDPDLRWMGGRLTGGKVTRHSQVRQWQHRVGI